MGRYVGRADIVHPHVSCFMFGCFDEGAEHAAQSRIHHCGGLLPGNGQKGETRGGAGDVCLRHLT